MTGSATATPATDTVNPVPGADDIQQTANETLDRVLTGTITVLPFVGLGLACWQLWGSALHWHDVVVFAVLYLITGLGITIPTT